MEEKLAVGGWGARGHQNPNCLPGELERQTDRSAHAWQMKLALVTRGDG